METHEVKEQCVPSSIFSEREREREREREGERG